MLSGTCVFPHSSTAHTNSVREQRDSLLNSNSQYHRLIPINYSIDLSECFFTHSGCLSVFTEKQTIMNPTQTTKKTTKLTINGPIYGLVLGSKFVTTLIDSVPTQKKDARNITIITSCPSIHNNCDNKLVRCIMAIHRCITG